MIDTILRFIFYFVLSAVCFYLLGTLTATFMVFELHLSVFDVSTWHPIFRLSFFAYSLTAAFWGSLR
jgi:hypothetical protein